MRLERKDDVLTQSMIITMSIPYIDYNRGFLNVPKTVRQWYESLPEKKLSDELFYLSEIAKGLE